jgi:pimeloyl-ACP methyl ester carboxylesterase
MAHVTSKDGTHIAYSKTGQGEPLIIVNGAMGFREFYGDQPLASMLSEDFTVYTYDRRGRGESTDSIPKKYEVRGTRYEVVTRI